MWFMDGVLLKQLPLCDDLDLDLCDLDPSQLLLEHVTRSFHGNYSCMGASDAGWSAMSQEKQLQIYCEFANTVYENMYLKCIKILNPKEILMP